MSYITATCRYCKQAFLREVPSEFFEDISDHRHYACPKCKRKGKKDRPPLSEEEKAKLRIKMAAYRNKKGGNRDNSE